VTATPISGFGLDCIKMRRSDRRIAASPHRRIADLLDQAAQPVDQGLTLHTQPA
jgi:hypothetical protein